MADRRGPAVYNIPPHRSFADALVAGLVDQFGGEPLTLARGAILLPNNRASLAVRDAFVRQAEPGLLLPRLVPIGDDDLDARLGAALDPMGAAEIPPAISPLHRQLIMAQRVQEAHALARAPVDAAEAMHQAAALAHVLDQLTIEGVALKSLADFDAGTLSAHWQDALAAINVLLAQWPEELSQRGVIDLTDRRNRLLEQVAKRWLSQPPGGFVVAAGISTTAPAVASLLRVVARLPRGQVVLAGLDQHMDDAEWSEIGGASAPALEVHPQYHLHLLLSRIGVARGEVKLWRRSSDRDALAQRSHALSFAMQPAGFTTAWHTMPARKLHLAGIDALACETPAHEAQVIALALREALETPSKTAALVTPDRDLARRVVALLARWKINADDSAGQPLSATRIGGLLLSITDAVASDFAPAPLLTLLKHPLVMAGEQRLTWLDGVRELDLALRGPRPAGGLDGLAAFLATPDAHQPDLHARAARAWTSIAGLLGPLSAAFSAPDLTLPRSIAAIRDAVHHLCGDEAWAGSAGHAAAELVTQLEALGAEGPQDLSLVSLPRLLRELLEGIAVRVAATLHPRVSIWGLLEAKLQSADLMILGGLNEGVWPALPAPDPWLAPAVRRALGLPALERRIGLSAHDLVSALGAKSVLLTRAKRDARASTVPSRFWLRLDAFTGGLPKPKIDFAKLAHDLDQPAQAPNFGQRPAPQVLAALRPRRIRVTQVDSLNADPYAFYASAILNLNRLDGVEAEPGPAWRGSLIHTALERWAKDDDYRPDRVAAQVAAAFASKALHPLLTTLWEPRFTQVAERFAAIVTANRDQGRTPIAAEVPGEVELGGVLLRGKLDRVDQTEGGALAILDYKTGDPPKPEQLEQGYAMQLGLIGLMAQRGAFPGVTGTPVAFEYWSLARDRADKKHGYVRSTLTKGQTPDDYLRLTEERFISAAGRWLTGTEPFYAKRAPEFAYSDFDHLMRLEEWAGRDA